MTSGSSVGIMAVSLITLLTYSYLNRYLNSGQQIYPGVGLDLEWRLPNPRVGGVGVGAVCVCACVCVWGVCVYV